MTRIVMIGYQGMGSVGDEAILSGIEELLRGTTAEVVAVASGRRAAIPAFPRAERVPTPRFLPGRAFRRALRRADLVVMAGGGLLNDYWPTLIPRLLTWSLLSRLLGTRVGWLAAGVGPLQHRRSQLLARAVLGLASFISVRDEASAALVTAIRGKPTPRVLPDPALFLPPPIAAGAARGLALIVRGLAPGDTDQQPLVAALAELALAEIGDGVPVTVVTMHRGEDEETVALVQAAIRERHGTEVARQELPVDPAEALAALAGFEAVVSVRLHGVLLAALAARPWVGIGYDPKVEAAAGLLGVPRLALPVRGLTSARLRTALADARQPQTRATVAAALARVRARRAETVAWLIKMIG